MEYEYGKIFKFLMDVNNRLNGIMVIESQDIPRQSFLKFELELQSPHINKACFWSPSSLGQKIIEDTVHKYFNVYQEIGWNNTRTVFWFTAKD